MAYVSTSLLVGTLRERDEIVAILLASRRNEEAEITARYSRPIISSLKCSKESAVRSRLPIAVSLAIGATPA